MGCLKIIVLGFCLLLLELMANADDSEILTKWVNPQYSCDEVSSFRKKATKGDAKAMYFYSIALANGYGCEKDCAKSFNVAQDAAKMNYKPAYYLLAHRYAEGRGVESNQRKSQQFFEKFVKWANQLGNSADPETMCNLGWCYRQGCGVDKDTNRAIQLFKEAASRGHARAQYNLGWSYATGSGVPISAEKAAEWFIKSANNGSVNGQRELGCCYMKGFGVAKDATEGIKWIRKAAERGLPIAQYDLGMSYIDGTGVAKDLYAAKLWLSRAQDNGYAKASRALSAVEEVIMLSETKSALESAVKEVSEIKNKSGEIADALEQEIKNRAVNNQQ